MLPLAVLAVLIDLEVAFHKIPCDKERQKLWRIALRLAPPGREWDSVINEIVFSRGGVPLLLKSLQFSYFIVTSQRNSNSSNKQVSCCNTATLYEHKSKLYTLK